MHFSKPSAIPLGCPGCTQWLCNACALNLLQMHSAPAAYMAPEVIRAADHYDGKLADLWSCGVMLYVMLFGQYPFESSSKATAAPGKARMDSMMQKILHVEWSLPSDVEVTADCKDLLAKLLVGEPLKRLTMDQIQHHKWFQTNLPPDALSMNANFLTNTDFSGVQSEEDIKRLLQSAQTPGPNKYQFATEEEDYSDLIETEIADELTKGVSVKPGAGKPGAKGAAPAGAAGAPAVAGTNPAPLAKN